MSGLNAFKELLDQPRQVLKVYGVGAVLFFLGIGFIIYADRAFPPSLQQEIVALAGTATAGLGFFTAMAAQLLLILSRLKNMGQKN